MPYVMYLRKSRADVEAEQRGEGETLARHEAALLALADRLHITVSDIYREIVSGETIAARPVMQKLLAEVDAGLWDGVLVMEVERLARGDTVDQGIVAQAFKYSDTLIITPTKTYNPNDEFDEEYFEFGLFMSRREYKTIKRRLRRGIEASVNEGKYVGGIPPFGYDKVKLPREKGYSLVPNPNEASYVKLIFQWYTADHLGPTAIAKKLNDFGIVTRREKPWSRDTVREVIQNPVYIGKIRWKRRPQKTHRENGEIVKSRPRNSAPLVVDGRHEPIISEEDFQAAQELLEVASMPSVPVKREVRNPLAGIVICGKCGHHMQRMKYRSKYAPEGAILGCVTIGCDTVSTELSLVEARILAALRDWLEGYKLDLEESKPQESASLEPLRRSLKAAEKEIKELEAQEGRLYDLLERGVYDSDTFLKRKQSLAERILEQKTVVERIGLEIRDVSRAQELRESIIPEVTNLLDVYDYLETPAQKNTMLKTVLEKVVYRKEKEDAWTNPSAFEIDLYPKLPRFKGP